MDVVRPDLSQVDPAVVAYIEYLESEVERLHRPSQRIRVREEAEGDFEQVPEIFEPAEPPTTVNVITATAAGIAKRTPRHLYNRQRRGGMGVFDLETSEDEPPAIVATADEGQNLILITSLARAFRLPVSAIAERPVRARGEAILGRAGLGPGEQLAAILADRAQGYVALLSQTGMVRLLRHHIFGEFMKPGTALYDARVFGPLASACWTPGDGELFIATRQGRAIRFSEKQVPPQGGQGIRLGNGDLAVGIAAVYPDSGVFLVSADGKGTIRQMEGFSPNKAPGAGGKIAINSDELVAALTVDGEGDIFLISRLSKMIRFQSGEVPSKEGVVQGVICMSLRADETVAAAFNPSSNQF